MTWIETIQARLPFAGPPERRSESQIERDLEDEFAFHLEMKTRELMNEGHDLQAARGLALGSFGNVELIKKRCKRIALEERIMLQRVNFVMMIVVVMMVVAVGVQVMITQRYNTVALQDITAQIAKMRLDAAAEANERGWASPTTTPSANVPQEGTWIEVDGAGQPIEQGWVMQFIMPSDLRYRWPSETPYRNPIAFVTYARKGSHNTTPVEWRFGFSPNYELWIRYGRDTDVTRRVGRWTWEGDMLVIDIPDDLDGNAPPRRFMKKPGLDEEP